VAPAFWLSSFDSTGVIRRLVVRTRQVLRRRRLLGCPAQRSKVLGPSFYSPPRPWSSGRWAFGVVGLGGAYIDLCSTVSNVGMRTDVALVPPAGIVFDTTLRCQLHIPGAEAGMKILLGLLLALAMFGCRTNESPEGQAHDLQITAHVKSKLASDVGLSTVTNISVNSTNGVVTLAGQVNSTEAKVRAEAAAASVPMVVRVVNNIQVTAKPS